MPGMRQDPAATPENSDDDDFTATLAAIEAMTADEAFAWLQSVIDHAIATDDVALQELIWSVVHRPLV